MNLISKIEVINMGGDCFLQVIHLTNGQVIGINDESIEVYSSIDELLNPETLNS